MAFLAKYFKQEVVGNVKADTLLEIRSLGVSAAAAANSSSDAAAAGGADEAETLQLAKFPAHSIILDNSEYFLVQQVSCSSPWTAKASLHT
jgi:hypothetical protein